MKNQITILALLITLVANAQWKKDFFVDEFKEPTKQEYTSNLSEGYFSNSATNKSDLIVATQLWKENTKLIFVFKFYEYGDIPANFSSNYFGDIKLRKNGIDYNFRVSIGDSGTLKLIKKKDIESILNMLKEGGEIMGYYEHITTFSKSTYNFTIDSEGFKEVYDSL